MHVVLCLEGMGKNRDGKPQKEGTEGLHFRGQVEDPAVKSKNDRKLEKCYGALSDRALSKEKWSHGACETGTPDTRTCFLGMVEISRGVDLRQRRLAGHASKQRDARKSRTMGR